ncbi:transglutaminase-like domain-containing protein [Anaerosphaera multitolerans]|uniref:Transglutaminase domain-containing protein n=1 Tax=Anaerosphaera multitolerans TaxID=2487351 RepID=A0A437S5X9_9FIRM|nr:transglutaminase-like domain-containing protein [Anaerosphaera multitolerans]RVU54404.1 transglutaminase domain-containing protein [Anaerosphaera multitolerans]
MNENLKYLEIELPEDIGRLKACGDFERAIRVIDRRLKKELPTALKKRLELEKEILEIIPKSYIYDYDEALELLQNSFKDFKKEELDELWELDSTDWYYINGKVHFKDDIVANLVKTVPQLAKRVIDKRNLVDKEGNFSLLNETITKMKKRGKLGYKIRIKAFLKINEDAEKVGEKIRVHLPIPIEGAQIKNVKLLDTSHTPKVIGDPTYPARTVYFEEDYRSKEEFYVEYEYENIMEYVNPDYSNTLGAQPTFYTEELSPHIVFTPYIKYLTVEVIGDETNPLKKARKIYDFITKKIMYSFVRPYYAITNIPMYGATSLKGDCGIQALLFITMCRFAGIPARWQAGLYSNPLSIGNHDWAQFYIAPFGWLYADCSFGGAAFREGDMDRWNFYFGNLEPFRMVSILDFQHELNPQLKYLRKDPYDNQSGEAEYESGPLKSEDLITEQRVIEIEEII